MPQIRIPRQATAAALLPLALSLLLASPHSAGAQSFNCRYAHYADEAAVCQDPALGRLDNQLNSVYNGVMRRLPSEAQRRLDRDEDSWVAQRRQCGADPACITRAYHQRMHQLDSEVGSVEQPMRHPPAGFPPPPPFHPYGGAPVAVAPGFPPPPPFGPPRQTTETIEERGAPAPQIERRQSTETTQERETRSPRIEQRQSTEIIEKPGTPAPQIERRQSTESTQERDTRPPRIENQTEGTAEPPAQRETVSTETRSASDRDGMDISQPTSDHKSSKRKKASRSTKAPHETGSESHTDQATSDKPTSPENAPASSTHKETHAVAAPPPPPPPPASSGLSEAPTVKQSAPAKTTSPPAREQKREAAAAPAQQQQSSASSEAPSKPAIRWVDPPPSH
jgi:uncharacterized protein YecT (DUF1311 family)